MQLTVGSIVEGKVTGITKFGAFVDLGEGKTGMVHISEVAASYVKDIRDHLTEGQTIKVKILNISEDGKIGLSIKRTQEMPARPAGGPRSGSGPRPGGNGGRPSGPRGGQRRPNTYAGGGFNPNRTNENMSFEDMMAKDKQTSDDKRTDLKRVMDAKRGAANRRSQNH